jgi:hypothetical protein
MHVTTKVTVTQERKSFVGKKVFFLVIGKHICFLCFMWPLGLWFGYGGKWVERKRKKKKKRKEQTKWYPPFFPPKCLQFGMDASHGPKNMGKKKAIKHESRKARLAQKQPPPSSNFFSSLWVFGWKQLGSAGICGRDKLCSS